MLSDIRECGPCDGHRDADGAGSWECRSDARIFLILRFTGMRRESVASLRDRNLCPESGVSGVPVKGGKTRVIPLPGASVRPADRGFNTVR